MIKNRLCLLCLLLFFSSAGMAGITPSASSKDSRIQSVDYDPDNVVNIRAQIGRTTLIQLEQDERLLGDSAALGMGDSEAWNLAVKGNNIMFKPKAASPTTNMIVTTNKRTYVFHLSLVSIRKGKKPQSPTYILRFNYPDTARTLSQAELAKQEEARRVLQNLPRTSNTLNHHYWGKGDKALAPTATFDNGLFTFFQFNNGRDLPTVYKIMPDGSEMLLNTHIEGDTVIVHEIARNFVLRLGKTVLGIENRGFDEKGQFNRTGTANKTSVRIVR